jgi:beta-xylosidase
MLSLHGLRKPVFVAHQMLNRLGSERVVVDGDGKESLVHAIVTRRGESMQALVYALIETSDATPTQVEIVLPKKPKHAPQFTRLGASENNILSNYRELGSPANPTREQLKELRAVNTFAAASASEVRIEQRDGQWLAAFKMETPGLALLEID